MLCNTHLLDMTRFRKNQVFFVNKRDDGSSDLYSLFDYREYHQIDEVKKVLRSYHYLYLQHYHQHKR